jgi:hypothetical protein
VRTNTEALIISVSEVDCEQRAVWHVTHLSVESFVRASRGSHSDKKSPARSSRAGQSNLGGGAQTPRKVDRCFRSSARVAHNAGMAHAPNFKLALTRVIVLTGGPGTEPATLEDAARFVGLLRSWRLCHRQHKNDDQGALLQVRRH